MLSILTVECCTAPIALDPNYMLQASVISIGAGAGLLAGQALAGFMGPTVGWRYPFLVVSLPSMAFAALVSARLLFIPLAACCAST